MKPPPFDYVAPRMLQEALAVLGETGVDTKVIAGGQSLVPMMNFRLARPERLVDVNRVSGISQLRKQSGTLRIGAMTRQATVERSATVARHWPLLHRALAFVGHPQIRNRGTIGGSIAHADPGAEICTTLLAYDGSVEVASIRGTRAIAARDLFLGQFVTSLETDELITAIVLPAHRSSTGTAFHEVARRRGDFALAGAAAVLTTDEAGRCTHAALSLLGVASTPVRATVAEDLLVGSTLTRTLLAEVVEAASAGLSPASDVHGSSTYRVQALREMVRRSVTDAFGNATDGAEQVRSAS